MEEVKKDFDVSTLREYYKDANEYIEAKAKYDKIYDTIKLSAEEYEKELKTEIGLNDLIIKKNELDSRLDYFDELRPTGYETERGVEEFDNFTEEELEEFFEVSKQYELLKKKIKKQEENIKERVAEYENKKQELNKTKIQSLKRNLIKKGHKLIDIESIKKDKKHKYDIKKIDEMLVDNRYNDPTYFENNWKKREFSALQIYWNLKADNYVGNLAADVYDKYQYFDYSKHAKNYPSTMEYFIDKLEKHTGKKYEKVSIITNQTEEWHDSYEPNNYVVYGATLILPSCLAGTLLLTEKKITKEKLHDFVKKHKEVILLEDKDVIYYTDEYSNDENFYKDFQNNQKKKKFNETYRKEARRELSWSTDSNSIDLEKLFDMKDYEYGMHEEPIIGNIPCKVIADAVFDTLEYAKKLYRLAELEKVVNKRKKQEDAEKEYEELKKTM